MAKPRQSVHLVYYFSHSSGPLIGATPPRSQKQLSLHFSDRCQHGFYSRDDIYLCPPSPKLDVFTALYGRQRVLRIGQSNSNNWNSSCLRLLITKHLSNPSNAHGIPCRPNARCINCLKLPLSWETMMQFILTGMEIVTAFMEPTLCK